MVSRCPSLHEGCSLAVSSSVGLFSRGAWCRHPSVVSVTRSLVPSVVAPEYVVSLTSWSVRGAGWFCLWALDQVEVASFPAGSECVVAVTGCTCFERGCCFARAVVGFFVDLGVREGVSRRLRAPTCGVAFTGAGLWSAEPVEGVLVLLVVPLLLGCVLVGCPLLVGVCPYWMSPCCWGVCLALRACALLGTVLFSVVVVARAKQMLVCCVAPLVECCDTYLWLLSALCWLVVDPGEVLPEFFSASSGGGEVFPRTLLCSFLVVAVLPSGLSLPELLVVVLVRFALRTVLACFYQLLCYLR
ncbi:hypothetical protein Taro_045528, partial [Colocasia esculenta]|nr:hypothetical protein [Colocasia esculenta]